MKLYVCWAHREPFHEHACRTAHRALLAAGHEPDLVKVRGLGVGPKLLQRTTEQAMLEAARVRVRAAVRPAA